MRLEGYPAKVLEALGIEELFPPQREALAAGILDGRSVVVSSPTGSGKSLIALLAAASRLEEGGRVVYVAPLRSLVYERAEEWRRVLEPLGVRVAASTGDYDRVEPWLGRADAVLLTYEKLDSLLRHGVEWLRRVSLLVVDEAHYIGDKTRGPVLELAVARMTTLNPGLQVVAMSATIPNAGEIAGWLSARLVESDWRPVPLREGVARAGTVLWSDGGEDEYDKLTGNTSLDLALDAVAEGGQALVFVQSRRKAVALARKLYEAASRPGVSGLLPSLYPSPLRGLLERPEHRSLNSLLAQLSSRGIGFHHAGLASYQREAVEKAFRERRLLVLFATPTLAAGVNLPARRVVVDSLYRYSGGRSEPITVSEYKQLAGRAGRPGLDKAGEAVIAARSEEAFWNSYYGYVKGSPEPVVSKLVSEKALRSQVLAAACGSGSGVVEVFEHTFYAYLYGSPAHEVEATLRKLEEMGMVVGGEATRLGRRVAELYIDPLTAWRMRRGLERLWTSSLELRDALFLSLWNSDAVLLRPPRGEALGLEAEAEEYLEGLGFHYGSDYLEPDIAVAAKALYTAEMLSEWINGVQEDVLLERYGIDPGDLRAVVETAAWLAYSLAQIAGIMGHPAAEQLADLEIMVRYGVPRELVPLVKLPGIGRVRARLLYEAGLRSPEEVAKLSPEQLSRLIKGLGETRARETVEAAARSRGGGGAKKRGQTRLLDFLGGR